MTRAAADHLGPIDPCECGHSLADHMPEWDDPEDGTGRVTYPCDVFGCTCPEYVPAYDAAPT